MRIIKFALQDIGRNLSLSLMTILILVLMLLSVNTLVVIRILTEEATTIVKSHVDLSIFFDHTAKDERIEEVRTYISSLPEVVTTTFYGRDEVLAQFRETHKQNADILASLDEIGDNPLGATLIIKGRDPKDYEQIIKRLLVPEYDEVIVAKTFGDTQKAIDKIHIITTQVERFSLALSILFAVIAFLIIFNTIRVGIYTQRIEISIKKLVGATNRFIRGPFIVEALLFSIISVIFTYGLIVLGASLLDPYVATVFGKSGFLTDYFASHILWLFGIQFAAVLFLTVVTSFLAMRKYLRA